MHQIVSNRQIEAQKVENSRTAAEISEKKLKLAKKETKGERAKLAQLS